LALLGAGLVGFGAASRRKRITARPILLRHRAWRRTMGRHVC
jgi:hypothetical protein